MPSVNHVTLVGRLAGDPEAKSESAPATFAIVVKRRQLNKQTNEWEDAEVSFLDVVCWGKLRESVLSLQKGTEVAVIGRLKQETYEDKEGNTRRAVKIIADSVSVVQLKAVVAAAFAADEVEW